jgi:hypothetical protein
VVELLKETLGNNRRLSINSFHLAWSLSSRFKFNSSVIFLPKFFFGKNTSSRNTLQLEL